MPASGVEPGPALPAGATTARVDRNGCLVRADEPLLQLHHDLGGSIASELAVPPLLDLVRHCLRLGMRLSRPVTAASPSALIDLWCECAPDATGATLALTRWAERPLPASAVAPHATLPLPSDPHGANIRLDRLGRIIQFNPPHGFIPADAGERFLLKPLSALLHTDDDEPIENPLSIDGQRVRLVGDTRCWIASLPGDAETPAPVLTLREASPLDDADATPPLPPLFDGERIGHLFGSQIGPALRLPIGRIIANAETIGGRLEGPLRADYAGYASDIASAGRHLLALVDDLADLEAIEASGFSAAREPVDLADLSRRAAGLLALKAADRQIRIDKPADDEMQPAVGEFRRVLQVLLNLLGNAINYAPDGSMIWLRLDDGPGWASVTVADQGPGLSSEDQQRLFNKWERLGRSGDGGSGLGLYISRRLALVMDGDLTIESAPGQGARFTLMLPTV